MACFFGIGVWTSQVFLLLTVAILARTGLAKADRVSGPTLRPSLTYIALQALNTLFALGGSLSYILGLPVNDFRGVTWLQHIRLPSTSLPYLTYGLRWIGLLLVWASYFWYTWSMWTICHHGSYGGMEIREKHRLCSQGCVRPHLAKVDSVISDAIPDPMLFCDTVTQYTQLALPVTLGITLALWNWVGALQGTGLVLSFIPKIMFEEADILHALGEKYMAYRKQTPYRIIPGMY